MKRVLWMLLLLLLLPVMALGEDVPEGAIYKGRMYRDTAMRHEPVKNGSYYVIAKEDSWVYILEYGDEWCYCSNGKGSEGWITTGRIYELWRLTDEPLPGWVPMAGVARVTRETHLEIDGYAGNTLEPGTIISAINEQGEVPMMRATARLEEGAFTFEPFVAAEEAQPGDLLYAFTTWYNETTGSNKGSGMAEGRRANIELAVSRIDGRVLQPGEQFSFNDTCAPYNKGNGYVKAPNISVSGVGVGGGVCQISTTIFDAMLGLQGLRLDEWGVHSFQGVPYAPLNFDSVVASWKDFVFTNAYDYPVTLRVITQEGALTALFYRAEESD